MYGSMFLFINNEISFVDVMKSTLYTDTGNIRTRTRTIDKKTSNAISKLLTVKVLPANNKSPTDYSDLGLPIQLMDESYKILLSANTDSGSVMFDLSQLDSIPSKFIILSPATANEILITSETGYVELMIDEEEQLPLQITSKYLAEK